MNFGSGFKIVNEHSLFAYCCIEKDGTVMTWKSFWQKCNGKAYMLCWLNEYMYENHSDIKETPWNKWWPSDNHQIACSFSLKGIDNYFHQSFLPTFERWINSFVAHFVSSVLNTALNCSEWHFHLSNSAGHIVMHYHWVNDYFSMLRTGRKIYIDCRHEKQQAVLYLCSFFKFLLLVFICTTFHSS